MNKPILTHVRLRAAQAPEAQMAKGGVEMQGNLVSVTSGQRAQKKSWSFDACHGEDSGQIDIFDQVKPVIDTIISGKSATVIAYGATGSGKTYTMEGTPQEPGLIRRAVGHLLDRLYVAEVDEVVIKVSFLEILKDQVYDLLAQRADPQRLAIRTDANGNNVIDGLSRIPISHMDEFERLFSTASRTRKTASTKLNSHSSRSHAILTVYTSVQPSTGGQVREGQLSLADLAGSENNAKTGNTAERMQESKFINQSLSTLTRVVEAIRKKQKIVPYRECKLTRILQPALGGGSKAVLICCIASGAKYTNDTVNTLDFADRAKKIEDVSVYVDPENRRLSMSLARSRPATALGTRQSLAPILTTTSKILGDGAKIGINSKRQSMLGGVPPRNRALGDVTNRRFSHIPTISAVEQKGKGLLQAGKDGQFGSLHAKRSSSAETNGMSDNAGYVDQKRQREGATRQVSVSNPCDVVQRNMDWTREEQSAVESASTPVANGDLVNPASVQNAEACGEDVGSMTEEEKDAKARALVKQARKYQLEGNLELARKLFIHAKPFIKDTRTVTKRIYALEAEMLSHKLSQDMDVDAQSSSGAGQKRAIEAPYNDAGVVDGDVDMDAQPYETDATIERGEVMSIATQGWRVAALCGTNGLPDLPSPAKRARAPGATITGTKA